MDETSSTAFRKGYAGLRRPTRVMVNGHPIGEWTPYLPVEGGYVPATFVMREGDGLGGRGLSTRPFTPVPKKGG